MINSTMRNTPSKHTLAIYILYMVFSNICSAQTTQQKIDSLKQVLLVAKDDTNKVLLLAELSNEYSKINLDTSRAFATQALTLSEKKQYSYGQLKANNLIGRSYALQNNIPSALRHYNTALSIARIQKNPARIAIMAVAISALYTQNADWDKAYQYLMIAKEAYEKAGIPYPNSLCINMGYYYSAREDHKEAISWYRKAVENEEKKATHSPDLAQLYGNIGGELILLNQYHNALSYLYKALALNTAMGNDKGIAFNLSGIGSTYAGAYINYSNLPDSMKDGPKLLAKAEHYLLDALQLNNKIGLQDNKLDIYNWLSFVGEKKQDYKQAYIWHVAYTKLKDSIKGSDVQKEIAHVEAEFRVQKTTDSLKYSSVVKDIEIKRNKLQRNAVIALIIMTGLLGVLFINRQKLKHRNKLIAVEAEKEKIEQLSRHQLEDFTKSIQEKNNLIEQFTSEIEKYQALPCANEIPLHADYLYTLKRSVILTDEQWAEFQALFEKVDPGYIGRVRTKFPDITAAEMRFVLLTKLGLNNKEMAAMLGVSNDAVRVSKYRLLKKIQLPDDISPEDFFNSI